MKHTLAMAFFLVTQVGPQPLDITHSYEIKPKTVEQPNWEIMGERLKKGAVRITVKPQDKVKVYYWLRKLASKLEQKMNSATDPEMVEHYKKRINQVKIVKLVVTRGEFK